MKASTCRPGIRLAVIALIVVSLMIVCISTAHGISASTPFSISIVPKSATLKPGDSITYHIKVDAPQSFTDKISFTLFISAPAYSTTFDLGTVSPPYPKEFDYSFIIPSNIPVSVTVKGVLTAKSGNFVQTENVEITIQSQSASGNFFGQIIKIFNDLWNWLMHLFGR